VRSHTHRTFQQGGEVLSKRRLAIIFPSIAPIAPELLREALMTATPSTVNHGFELLREQNLAEINSTARYYRHVKTGAELLSLVNSDENKVFGVSFATPPSDSTGVAHILEHSVLCGSRKYPINEEIISTTAADIRNFADAMADVAAHGRVIVLGSEQAIEAANSARPGLLSVSRVM
jgi:hypothetical protein